MMKYKANQYAKQLAAICLQDKPTGVLTFDGETSMEGPEADPAPYGPNGAKVLLWAMQKDDGIAEISYGTATSHLVAAVGQASFIVAHNIKFDWQHLLNGAKASGIPLQRLRRSWVLKFWDTSIAEYILTAQTARFASLGEVAEKHKVGKKTDVLDAYIKRGLRSQDIPLLELQEYAKNDVRLTYLIMLRQWAAADAKQRALIMVHSSMAVIFAEAEYNGLHVNLAEAVARRDDEQYKTNAVQKMFHEVARKFVLQDGWDAATGVNVVDIAPREQFNTPRALSMIMFGLPMTLHLKARLPVPVGRKKYVERDVYLNPSWQTLQPEKYGAKAHSDGKSYLLDESVLTGIIQTCDSSVHVELAKAVLESRAAEKKAVTYYQGLIERQAAYGDNIIHHTLNVTATATGRTSSSNPNSQNQPEEVKEIFEPGYGNVFCEFDFRQLEVWALAELSGCRQLQEDLRAGVDIHYETGRTAGLWITTAGMTKDTRRKVKAVNFGLIYGGGARTLSEQSGLDVPTVSRIIKAFYSRYIGVKVFHENACQDVELASKTKAQWLQYITDLVLPMGSGSRRWRMMRAAPYSYDTGRMYAFPESFEVAEWAKSPWSPTNIKNYPVQGFATGDIVPLALVLLDLELPPQAAIATAVHDSGLMKVEDTPSVRDEVDGVLKDLPGVLSVAARDLWGRDFTLLPGISVEWKNRWGGKPYVTYNVG